MEVACCVANWTIRRRYLEIYTIGWILLSCKLHDREDLAILLIALYEITMLGLSTVRSRHMSENSFSGFLNY